ncbi:hypothetical protein [Modestobacter marinus]|uniref:hypothetical protein n=1 Tax=Modestobacter marinus TaxID=477641 RepID=UPI001C975E4A|nr:hypothetical protein [Modestobacter marinus]
MSIPLALLAARYVGQPAQRTASRSGTLPPLPWAQLARPVVVTLVGGLVRPVGSPRCSRGWVSSPSSWPSSST